MLRDKAQMMFVLSALAALLIGFAGFCLLGVPYMLAGPRAIDRFAERTDQQLMAACLLGAAISLVLAPFFASGLISGSAHVQVFADTLTGFTGCA
ncbi:hypothetical protein [Hyphomonas johnsonii]|uniref:Uncharacterized protein n=1 Tax=Hyphomonas johnsonii MHS-2 TaxID=1280950 RepID=A0A059FMD7_9PROT|nr:hypothetical protein [Hyphomonas johnsonii]KCZ91840.1 hypothetical protein HJO_12002 [Hyphomonas johnsonii MHS-2]